MSQSSAASSERTETDSLDGHSASIGDESTRSEDSSSAVRSIDDLIAPGQWLPVINNVFVASNTHFLTDEEAEEEVDQPDKPLPPEYNLDLIDPGWVAWANQPIGDEETIPPPTVEERRLHMQSNGLVYFHVNSAYANISLCL